jgi:GT2 family glycosyltransferase
MIFSIIICTYCRPLPILRLLDSVKNQTILPFEVLVVDGSPDLDTEQALFKCGKFLPLNLNYKRVGSCDRGLTKQRNIGIGMADAYSEILVFLDDDVILEPDFLQNLISSFKDPDVVGADGLITNENRWRRASKEIFGDQEFDGYFLKLSIRNRFRSRLGLYPFKFSPGTIPPYGHGKSTLPPSGKIYSVEHIMGGITAYRKWIFDHINFSELFEGYGLYEDFDFSVRASRYGKLVTNTAARLEHHHAPAGRPNAYRFGKMVVWNGWYVWRLKHPRPGMVNILKWHAITLLLAFLRLGNAMSGNNKKQAWDDFRGRMQSWFRLWFTKPKIES